MATQEIIETARTKYKDFPTGYKGKSWDELTKEELLEAIISLWGYWKSAEQDATLFAPKP